MEEIVTHNFSPELEPGLTTEAEAVTGDGWVLTTGHVSPVSPACNTGIGDPGPDNTISTVCSEDHHGG